MSDIVNQQTNE